jgi:hypothetical protein
MSDPIAAVARGLLAGIGGAADAPQHVDSAHRFLAALAGDTEPAPGDGPLEILFRDALSAVRAELATLDLEAVEARLEAGASLAEALWPAMFPAAVGLRDDVDGAVTALRDRRRVTIDVLPDDPITDPAREILFTSNVLLGLPLAPEHEAALDDLPPDIAAAVRHAMTTEQRYWFDHPIPIGVQPEANELLHGLRGLDEAAGAEGVDRLIVLLSVSVTHPALRDVARPYVEAELGRIPPLSHLEVAVVSEDDVRGLVDDVLAPAVERWGPAGTARDALQVLGVDGEYGRHYSFLKAVAALWHVFVDPRVRATFKIDLDQVFPQGELLAETGRMALAHLADPAWGATGRDATGAPIELGMLAGALVNERDIGRGLFTPDVPVPAPPSKPSEVVVYPVLPQAISTQAEMLTREADGPIERIHVTGGTNGIRVDALRRHRPFTPSWVGRAEDQAYILSALGGHGPRLAYLHAPGLVMRHDKEAYAGLAIEAAHVGKLIGDDVRILVFSAYARAIERSRGLPFDAVKALLDPFTGAFVSPTPVATTLLRFALRILEQHEAGKVEDAEAYARIGARRLREVLEATADIETYAARIEAERRGWHALYDALDGLEGAVAAADGEAVAVRDRGRALLDGWRAHRRTDVDSADLP